MIKPTQYELDTCLEVLEYMLAELEANEPYATSTIEDLKGVIESAPRSVEDLGDVDDG